MTLQIPFTILVDTNELRPFTFESIRADKKFDEQVYDIPTKRKCLGRHPHGLGDYSIEGYEHRIAVERKSVSDIQSTVLGWSGARDRFEQELRNFSRLEFPAVIIEGTLAEVKRTMPQWGSKSRELNWKLFDRSQMAYRQDYTTQWFFCESRRHAETMTFDWFHRFWRKYV